MSLPPVRRPGATVASGACGRIGALVAACAFLLGCPTAPDDWQDDRGEAVVRVRAARGDTFVKLKEGLARTLFEGLDGEERCGGAGGCKRSGGAGSICSTANIQDPFVCELHLVDGQWVAPRDDQELYHSAEANRRYGSALLDGDLLTLDGDAGDALSDQLGTDPPVTLRLLLHDGAIVEP